MLHSPESSRHTFALKRNRAFADPDELELEKKSVCLLPRWSCAALWRLEIKMESARRLRRRRLATRSGIDRREKRGDRIFFFSFFLSFVRTKVNLSTDRDEIGTNCRRRRKEKKTEERLRFDDEKLNENTYCL